MATPIQNLTTALTGLLGKAPTNTQLMAVGDAYFYYMTDDDAVFQFGYPKASMTQADKAQASLTRIRASVKQMVYQAGVDATNDANAAAAAAAGNSNSSGL